MFKFDASEVLRNLGKLERGIDRAAADVAEEKAKKILDRAQELTPVRTGHLRDSGEVRMKGTTAIIEFTASYALPVHERTDIFHSNGQAKFLETALNEFGQLDAEFADMLTHKLKAIVR